MQLPNKITPDRIHQAIVEIRYESSLPFEILLGMFFNSLDKTYFYTTVNPRVRNNIPLSQIQRGLLNIDISQIHFYNEKIQVTIRPNAWTFSCIKEYIGWNNYLPEIEKVVKQFFDIDVINHVTRIGVRYISRYPSIPISEFINFSFSFGMPEVNSENYLFRSEFNKDDCKVLLNLHNNVRVAEPDDANSLELKIFSIVDIDVIKQGFNEKEIKQIIKYIDNAHFTEKSVFFKLLKSDFLASLNPEY